MREGGLKKKYKILIWLAVCAVLLFTIVRTAFTGYVSDYVAALSYEPAVAVTETEDYLTYGSEESGTGFVFYPGAKVEEEAYAPVMEGLAKSGIFCVVVRMPYHLAVLKPDAAAEVTASFPETTEWYVGGHSLGGAMAAGYAAEHADDFSGLILLAAYPTKEVSGLPVLSVRGDCDGVLNREKYDRSIGLAERLTERVIEGGNHAGFGNYGAQKGDQKAQITKEEQWQMTIDYILNFVGENKQKSE